MGIGTALLGGTMDYLTGRETNKANRENTNALIAAQRENQERGLQSLTGSSPFQTTTRDAAGGFNVDQPGAAIATAARSNLSFGDVDRSRNINELTSNFGFTLPTLSGARDIIERDRALQQGQFDKGLGDIVTANQRQFGGISNTAQTPAAIDAISRFTQANRFGGEREALDLYAKSKAADIGNLQQQIAANQMLAPAPGFQAGVGPGTTAANLVAQTPPPAQTPDLSGALPWRAGSNVISQIQAQEQAALDNKRYLEALKFYADRLRPETGPGL